MGDGKEMMINAFQDFLIVIGIGTLLAICGCVVVLVVTEIKEAIRELKRIWRYKHRFDKPPTAKCYCKDCKWHNDESNRCYKFHEHTNRRTADNAFCCEAEPRKEIEV